MSTAAATSPVFVTLAELATLTGLSRTQVRRVLYHGRVAYLRTPAGELYDRQQLLEALAAQAGAR